jgi:chondroitin AC lyase
MKIFRSFLLLITILFFIKPAIAKDFDLIKTRVKNELLKVTKEKLEVTAILKKQKSDGSFEGINYSDMSRTAGFPHRNHLRNLETLSIVYQQTNSGFFQNKSILNAINLGMAYWAEQDFVGDNWHDNQITTPTHMCNVMLMVGEELPSDLVQKFQPIIGRANMNASGARPSGDRIVIAGILAKNLLFTNQKNAFEEIMKLIEGELKFNNGERGMQRDYSFHHREDRVNNTTSYGYGKYANAFGEWSYYVAGTSYAFSEKAIQHLVDYYLDGVYKQMVYGIYIDVSVQNRSITHKATFRPIDVDEIEKLLISTSYRKTELKEIIKLRKGEVKPNTSFAKFFWQTEHFVVQRPHFYTSVRMFSNRNRNMEVPYNGPGKPTHHRSDGTNYVQLIGNEYLNIWPVYNWQQISGATIMQKAALLPPTEIQKDGYTNFVGAVEDGYMGAVGFDFKSPHDQLIAKKSWFFFKDEYVCLGAGICSSPDLPVVSTINQSLLNGPVKINQTKKTYILEKGKRELEDVKWIWHENIAYVLPSPSKLSISNQEEKGSWADITDEKNASKEVLTMDVFNIGFNHGNSPKNKSYAYTVIPGISENELLKNIDRGIQILSNTSDIQAVRNNILGVTEIVFYRGGSLIIDNKTSIYCDSPAIVMLKSKDNEIYVSDPTRTLAFLTITLDKWDGIQENETSNSEENKTRIRIELPQGEYAGKSVKVRMKP